MFQTIYKQPTVFQCFYDSEKDNPFYVNTESFLNGQTEFLCSDGKTHVLTLEESQILLKKYKEIEKERISALEHVLASQTPSLFGIVYNWKGLKEENYLMTGEELMEYDDALYLETMNSPERYSEGGSCGWKTWRCHRLDTPEEVRGFLTGTYNGFPSEISPDNYSDYDNPFQVVDDLDEWYWETCTDGRDFGTADTVKRAIEILQIPKEQLSGKEQKPDWVQQLDQTREKIQNAFETYGAQSWSFCIRQMDGIPSWVLESEREDSSNIEVPLISEADADYYDVDMEAIALYYEIPTLNTKNSQTF